MTPRRTRLIRVPDLQIFRHVVRSLSSQGTSEDVQRRLVVVPTRSAGHYLGSPISTVSTVSTVTRDELYETLRSRLPNAPRSLTPLERDALFQATATNVDGSNASPPPSRIRPGLIAERLRFYDQLRRHSQTVKRFQELMEEALGAGAESDRGAARLLAQTRVLADAFHAYETRLESLGNVVDEHTLRARLLNGSFTEPLRHVIVTVADWIADPNGLFVADFDLLSRLPNLEAIDLVCTESVLGSGFHERLHGWWPGLEEENERGQSASRRSKPSLVMPELLTPGRPGPLDPAPWFTHRDREEEMIAIARRTSPPFSNRAVVFKRPLPYLYLASETLGAAGIPFQTRDALPLAAQPTAAAVDLVLDAIETRFTRSSLVALLRSPHFGFAGATRSAVAALDRMLSDARYLGELSSLEQLAAPKPKGEGGPGPKDPAYVTAVLIARELASMTQPAPASTQVQRLLTFLESHFTELQESDPFSARDRDARAAILDTLKQLAAAHHAHHDPEWSVEDLAAAVRRWIGEHTFAMDTDETGIHLLDDQAARYGDFEEITIVGLIEHEWPERTRANIFYPASLLKSLGWPSEKDRRAAADARFLDLIASAFTRTTLSTFTLDDDALVGRSLLLDEIARARLSAVVLEKSTNEQAMFPEDVLTTVPVNVQQLPSNQRDWTGERLGRSDATGSVYHGSLGAQGARPWSVSALETYLGCPFKFFAQHELKLEEEPDDEEVMDPRRQGQFVHEVFEKFFDEWQSAGRGAITPALLDDARALFVKVVETLLVKLPQAEGALERTRLLGSSAAAGLGEAVFRMEAERPTPVVERLLEHEFKGPFTITTAAGPRVVHLRGKADRVDLLADGTFRVIDYKLGWPPNRARALQLPIYGLCAEQRLTESRGRQWTFAEAAYLAFKGPKRVVPLFTSDRDEVLLSAQQRLADTLDAIERGEFPPTPDDVYRCETCSFAAVCRKDYVGDV